MQAEQPHAPQNRGFFRLETANRPPANFADGRFHGRQDRGGMTPEARPRKIVAQLCGGWSFGGLGGRCLCWAMKASNSSLSLA